MMANLLFAYIVTDSLWFLILQKRPVRDSEIAGYWDDYWGY